MDELELQQQTLTYLLDAYPNGLTGKGWDWTYLSANRSLTSELIEQHWDKLDMYLLSSNPSLTPELIHKHWDELCSMEVCKNPSITSEITIEGRSTTIVEEYWDRISQSSIDRTMLSMNRGLTSELIEKYWNELNKGLLAMNQALTPELIEKYWSELNKNLLTKNPSITSKLTINGRLTTIVEEHWYELNNSAYDLTRILTPDLIMKYWDKISRSTMSMRSLSSNKNLTLELTTNDWLISLIEQHWDMLDKKWLSSNPSLTPELIEKYWDELDKKGLSLNSSITPEFILKHWDELDLRLLSRNSSLGYSALTSKLTINDWLTTLVAQHLDELDMDELSRNSSIPYHIIVEHPDKNWNNEQLSCRTYMPDTRGRRTKSARKQFD